MNSSTICGVKFREEELNGWLLQKHTLFKIIDAVFVLSTILASLVIWPLGLRCTMVSASAPSSWQDQQHNYLVSITMPSAEVVEAFSAHEETDVVLLSERDNIVKSPEDENRTLID